MNIQDQINLKIKNRINSMSLLKALRWGDIADDGRKQARRHYRALSEGSVWTKVVADNRIAIAENEELLEYLNQPHTNFELLTFDKKTLKPKQYLQTIKYNQEVLGELTKALEKGVE
jgi:hypothetical protein